MVTQNFYDSLKDAAQSAVCSYLNAAENASSWLGSVSGVYLSDPSQYWKPALCDEDPATASNPVPGPFTGGQCVGVLYQVNYTYTVTDTPFSSSVNGRGPISLNVEAIPQNPPNSNFIGEIIFWTGEPNESVFQVYNFSRDSMTQQLTITSVVRLDGNPDNCGDPGPSIPTFPDTGAPLPPQPTTYIDFGGNTVNISPEFTLFAPVAIGPNIFAPVRVDLPDVSFEGTLTLAPEFNLELNPSGFDGSPGTSDEPNTPEDPITSPNTEDDDSSETLIGVHVRSQETGYNRQTQIDQGDSPLLVVARLGRVYFRVRMGGRLGWFGPIDIQTTAQYVPVPSGMYAVRAQCEWESGWSGEVIPVFGLTNATALS